MILITYYFPLTDCTIVREYKTQAEADYALNLLTNRPEFCRVMLVENLS